MRIGVDARGAAEERGGRGTMVRELLRHLDGRGHEVLPFARTEWGGLPFEWQLDGSPDPVWHLRAARSANRLCDAFISTNSYLTVWFLRVPTVMVVCDMVAFEPSYAPRRRSAIIERLTLPWAARRADVIAAISRSTADDLAARYEIARPKTVVTHLAAGEHFAEPPSAPAQRDKPYVLAVGTLEPRKNLPRLIEAFAALPAELRETHDLVLVGAAGWETDETLAGIARNPFVVTTGHVDDDALVALYRGATLFAYPSLYEGFGLPVLEAMAAGAPVLTSSTSSLPEIAGDAAIYVDPLDVGAISEGLAAALTDASLRAELVRAGRERAASFSWSGYAEQMVDAVERAVLRRR